MAHGQTDRSGADHPVTDLTERDDVVLDLRGPEPLIDLGDSSLAAQRPGETKALHAIERRDGTQRARYVAVVTIAVLNVFDLITTYVAISMGAHEANPIVAWMISSRFIIVAKVLVCGALIFGALFANRRRLRVTLPGLCIAWAVVGVYSLVVLLNTLNVLSRIGD